MVMFQAWIGDLVNPFNKIVGTLIMLLLGTININKSAIFSSFLEFFFIPLEMEAFDDFCFPIKSGFLMFLLQLAYKYSFFLHQIHENDLWFSEIMVIFFYVYP